MKKLLISTFAFLFVVACFGQKVDIKDVPSVVVEQFKKQYPSIEGAKWEKEKANFEVSFTHGGKHRSISYSADGNLLETEVAIDASEIPEKIMVYVRQQFGNKKVKEVSKITKANGNVTYEVEIAGKELFFDEQGNLVK